MAKVQWAVKVRMVIKVPTAIEVRKVIKVCKALPATKGPMGPMGRGAPKDKKDHLAFGATMEPPV